VNWVHVYPALRDFQRAGRLVPGSDEKGREGMGPRGRTTVRALSHYTLPRQLAAAACLPRQLAAEASLPRQQHAEARQCSRKDMRYVAEAACCRGMLAEAACCRGKLAKAAACRGAG